MSFSPEYDNLAHYIADEACSITAYDDMPTDELAALAHLQVQLYMLSRSNHGQPTHDLGHALRRMGETVIDRCMDTDDQYELATLTSTLADLSRTGQDDYTQERSHCDRLVVEQAMHNATQTDSLAICDHRATHIAMSLLTQRPLTRIVYDSSAPSLRRYEFSIGGDFYNHTLSTWAHTQQADGSWPHATLSDALERITLFTADFGSIAGIDNSSIAHAAYRYYASLPCDTPTELYHKYRACISRWDYHPTRPTMQSFITRSQALLSHPATSAADRFRLGSIIISALTGITPASHLA